MVNEPSLGPGHPQCPSAFLSPALSSQYLPHAPNTHTLPTRRWGEWESSTPQPACLSQEMRVVPGPGRQSHLHCCLAPRKGKGRISLGEVPRNGITASKGVHSFRQLIIAALLSGRAPDTPPFAYVA